MQPMVATKAAASKNIRNNNLNNAANVIYSKM